jgi:hypothetical protein
MISAELERMWKEDVLAELACSSGIPLGGAEEIHEKPSFLIVEI